MKRKTGEGRPGFTWRVVSVPAHAPRWTFAFWM
jgi:hypothetical protein